MSRMQEQRYELKYWITEDTAARVREYVQQYLLTDPFSVGQPNLSYPVHSLYLDSEGLDTYWHTVNGDKNRFKLRLRYYDDRPNSPVFFEVKRRLNNIILKERGGVKKKYVAEILGGQLAEREQLLSPNSDADLFAIHHFQSLMLHLCARPMLHIAYLREAYEKEGDNSVRVTMDRQVLTAPHHLPTIKVKSENPFNVFGPTVILELKFTDRFPTWFNHLVQTFSCTLTGAAKYAYGIEQRGTEWARQCLPESDSTRVG